MSPKSLSLIHIYIEKEKREAIEAGRRALNSLNAAKEHLLRETSQKSRLHSPAQITQKKQDDVIKL